MPLHPDPGRSRGVSSRARSVARGACLALVVFAAVAVAERYAARERTFHAWDFRAHHEFARDLAERLRADAGKGLAFVVRSVRNDAYNRLPALLVSPVLLAAGASRAAYLSATVLVFLLPAAAAGALLARSTARRATGDEPPLELVAIPALASAPLWATSLRGFPDAGGAALLAAAAAVWSQADPGRPTPRRWVGIGLLLAGAVLLRRTWIPPVAAFVLAIAVVDAAWALARPPRMRRLARAARGPLLVAVTTVAVIALCAWPTLRRYAGADLAAQFAGYRYGGDFAMRLAWIPSRLGLLTVIVGLGGLAWGLSRPGARRVCAALLAGALFAALVGARIQVLGLQHFCWFAPAAAVGFTLAARALGRRARLLGAGVAALALLPVLYAVAPVPRSAAGDRWLGRLRGWPEVRADYDSLRRLGTDVLVRLGAKGSVYVACSSSTFNSDLLRSVLDAAEPGAARRVLPTADVDFRDGAPAALFRARMVLVCEPVQYHLPPASQSVVTLAAEPFLAGSGVARHYRRLRAGWTLDHGVRVHAFVPGERVPEDERWEFLARFPPVG